MLKPLSAALKLKPLSAALKPTMRWERQHYKQSIRSCRDNYIKRLQIARDTAGVDARVAASTAVDEHKEATAAPC